VLNVTAAIARPNNRWLGDIDCLLIFVPDLFLKLLIARLLTAYFVELW
jgi:hypothetical protein